MNQQSRKTILVICQTSPVVPSRAMDRITDAAEFFLSIETGVSSVGHPSIVEVRRMGQVVAAETHVTRKTSATGLLYFLFVPWERLRFVRIALCSLDNWTEARDACFLGRFWLGAIAGILARKRGKVKSVIYWAGDYYPMYGSPRDRLVAFVFQMAERWVIRHSDEVWYLTKRMYDVHVSSRGRRLTKAPERIIPVLFDAHREVHSLWKPENLHRFVFVGTVWRDLGLGIVLPAIAGLRSRWPDIRLDVLGTGPDLEALKEEASRRGLRECVIFHGFIDDESRVHRIVAQAAAGFALYDPSAARYPYYTMTSKVYMYVGCGTPVIINENAGSYDYVTEGNAGMRAEYTVDSVIRSMEAISSNVEEHIQYRQAARALANGFDMDAQRLKEALDGCIEQERTG